MMATGEELDEPGCSYEAHTSYETTLGHWATETGLDPMVTTSLQLPSSVLNQVRALALRQGTRPSVVMRQLIEANLERDSGGDVVTKAELPDTIADVLLTDHEILRRLAGA